MIWWNGMRPSLERLNQLHQNMLPGLIVIEFIDCGDDSISARMTVDQRTVQPFGRLHGGASVVLAEAAGSMAAGLCVDPSGSLRWAWRSTPITSGRRMPAG
ncbi:MAG: hotdog fold thioesterase [Novosphingobium sp.]|nr:hotdog fold thioesterase [Novosphingobium sp.]